MRRPEALSAGDEAHDRLFSYASDKLRGSLLRVATDFPDHDNGFSLRIAIKQVERVDKIRCR